MRTLIQLHLRVEADSATRSRIPHTRSSAAAALAAFTISNGHNSPQAIEMRQIPKDPRRHPLWARREYVDFDAPVPVGVDLAVLGWDDPAAKSKKKKNKKKKKAATIDGKENGAAEVVAGEEVDGDSSA